MVNKTEIIQKAKASNISKPMFKSKDDNNFSLTKTGFEFVLENFVVSKYEIYADSFNAKDIINLNKVCKTPYYYDPKKNKIFHFDETLQAYFILYQDNFSLYLDGFN